MTVAKPASRPNVPHSSSGPCAKRPGWTLQALKDAFLGRSHRAKGGKAKLKRAIEETRALNAAVGAPAFADAEPVGVGSGEASPKPLRGAGGGV